MRLIAESPDLTLSIAVPGRRAAGEAPPPPPWLFADGPTVVTDALERLLCRAP